MSDDVIEMLDRARGELLQHIAETSAQADPVDAETVAVSRCVEFVDAVDLNDMTAHEFVNAILDIREASLRASGFVLIPVERSPAVSNAVVELDRARRSQSAARARLSFRANSKALLNKAQPSVVKKASGDAYPFGHCVLDYAATQIASPEVFACH